MIRLRSKMFVIPSISFIALSILVSVVCMAQLPKKWCGDDREHAQRLIGGEIDLPPSASNYCVVVTPRLSIVTFDIKRKQFQIWVQHATDIDQITRENPRLFREASDLKESHVVANGLVVQRSGFEVVYDQVRERVSAQHTIGE